MKVSAPGRALLVVLGLAVLAIACAVVPAAQAASGRVVPPGFQQRHGETLRALPQPVGAGLSSSLWDAQRSGALIAEWGSPFMLNATDATGKTVWSVTGPDVWTSSGKLPAALVAVFSTADPNVLRSGRLVAHRANGSVRFKKTFKNAFVVPLCDTNRRLEWVEVSAARVMRLFVRQDGVTHALRLPFFARKPRLPSPTACSLDGDALAIGSMIQPGQNGAYHHHVYWIRVNVHGVPRIVSDKRTDWVAVAMSPGGEWAATTPIDGYPKSWVRFGQFTGRYLPSDDTDVVQVGPRMIFECADYVYESDDMTTWGADVVKVVTRPQLYLGYQRTWTNDGKGGDVRFTPDPDVRWAMSPNAEPGSLTVVNLMDWNAASIPDTYADAMLVRGGQIATLSDTGTLAYIANPVPNP